jgi:hypothetical protein
MKAHRSMLMAAALAGAVGCSRQEAPKAGDGAGTGGEAETFKYLQEVGAIRTQVNADNRERIPDLLSTLDSAQLGDEAARIEGYRQSLAKLDVLQVDPGAVTFEQNFEHILEAYKAVCLDSAELFRDAKKINDQHPGSEPIFLNSDGKIDLNRNDTSGAVDSLLAIVDNTPKASNDSGSSLDPALVDKVRGDLATLRKAKSAHHEFTETLKVNLAERFPGRDWTAKEILPPK